MNFKDDGPSITVVKTGTPDALTVDETVLATNATADFSDNYTSTPTYGADGAGPAVTSAYTLGVSGSGAVSGLVDTASNLNVLLYLEGVQVVGRAGSAGGAIVFTVSVSAAGIVTLDQVLAVKHSNTTNPDDSVTLAAASLVTLTRTDTITDKDGDTNTGADTIGIGQALNFKDDGPSLSFGNLIGSGTVNPQFGNWTKAGGADAVANLDLALNSFTLVRPNGGGTVAGTGTLNEAAVSPDGSGNYHFTGQLTGDFDNNNTTPNTSVDFALDVLANGSYKLDLVQGFGSTQTLSTANGSLGAGGPDPVQTLTVGSESIVFFAANALAPTGTGTPPPNPVESNSLLAGIGLGAPDPTESQLQTNPLPSYIGSNNMNVSTSGIGVGNNVLQGDNLEAIGSVDESFVVNPSSLMTQVKVFIDNSVAGYNIATETLYYRVFYDDGSSSALVDVNTVTSEAGGQVSFVVNTVAGKLIDAVQFIMARGDIKIPVIEFTKTTTALASDVKLDFTATLTDGDGDQATSTFAANLMANQLSPTFDYILAGVNAKSDAFNIDLASTDDAWRIDNFQAGDKVVLLGSATNVAIDNSGANSIVTITETGGQTTVVTVVGVDLLPADVGFGGP